MAPSPEASGREPDLVAVIVTYNSGDVIDDLLDSIPAGMGALSAEVVVVDNGSQDDTLEILHKRGDCHVVASTNTGYAGGINLGVASARSGTAPVLILNPDIRLLPGAGSALISALDEANGVHIVAPRVRNPYGALEYSLRRRPTLLRALGLSRLGRPAFSEYVTEPEAYDHAHDVDWALGAALLVSRHCHNLLGGWDESYFLYSEETDLCLRAGDLGLRTRYAPDAEVIHIGGASGRTNATHSMQIINRVRLYRRRNGPAKAWLYWALTVLSELSWVARGHRQSRFAVRTLIRPSARPQALGCSTALIPT